MYTKEGIRRAFERAKGRSWCVSFRGINGKTAIYSVKSRTDERLTHTVTAYPEQRDRLNCSCTEIRKEPCWHMAAVASVRACRSGFGLPLDGPTAHELTHCEPQPLVGAERIKEIFGR